MASRKPRTTPRKRPQQDRSAATVDAIVQAAAYILVKQGWPALTTNRIAERAGVNIASLYQFFPNKEAIVVELQRRHVSQARSGMRAALPGLQKERSLRRLLELVVQAGVAEHRVAPALHRAFAEELPRSVRAPKELPDREVEALWVELLGPLSRNVGDLALAAFMFRVTLHALIHEAATDRPELLDHPQFVAEVVTLLERYLRRPPS